MKRTPFVCVRNSGRSQMAEAFANYLSTGTNFFESAGTLPSDRVNPVVVEAMSEVGIDMSGRTPKVLTQEMVDRAERTITMGCPIDEACPASSVRSEDWPLEDPSGKSLAEVRMIREQVKARVATFVEGLDSA